MPGSVADFWAFPSDPICLLVARVARCVDHEARPALLEAPAQGADMPAGRDAVGPSEREIRWVGTRNARSVVASRRCYQRSGQRWTNAAAVRTGAHRAAR